MVCSGERRIPRSSHRSHSGRHTRFNALSLRVLMFSCLCLLLRVLLSVASADPDQRRALSRAPSPMCSRRRPPQRSGAFEDHVLPPTVRRVTGQETVPFGVGIIETRDTAVASETCEELFTPRSPHIALSLAGAEIIGNGSGSHHQLRKLDTRIDLIRSATRKGGGVYLYSNQQGCDGSRLYFDGCSMIVCNGDVVAQASQFSVSDVEVVCATVDLDAVRSARGAVSSRGEQAAAQPEIPRVRVAFDLVDRESLPGQGARAGVAVGVTSRLPRPH